MFTSESRLARALRVRDKIESARGVVFLIEARCFERFVGNGAR